MVHLLLVHLGKRVKLRTGSEAILLGCTKDGRFSYVGNKLCWCAWDGRQFLEREDEYDIVAIVPC